MNNGYALLHRRPIETGLALRNRAKIQGQPTHTVPIKPMRRMNNGDALLHRRHRETGPGISNWAKIQGHLVFKPMGKSVHYFQPFEPAIVAAHIEGRRFAQVD